MAPRIPYAALVFALALIQACGNPSDLDEARRSERLGRYSTAISQYQDFARENPKDPDSAEALFRVGEIYRAVIRDYARARAIFAQVIELHPESPWSAAAREAAMNSPDYFSFDPPQKRTYGDSQTRGTNMKMVDVLSPDDEDPSRIKVERSIFAGNSLVSKTTVYYEKLDGELRERSGSGSEPCVLIRYPPVKGDAWESVRNGKKAAFKVAETAMAVGVGGKTYQDCLKILEKPSGQAGSWRAYYFAPFDGHILTAVETARGENRILEILSAEPLVREEKPEGGLAGFFSRVFGGGQ